MDQPVDIEVGKLVKAKVFDLPQPFRAVYKECSPRYRHAAWHVDRIGRVHSVEFIGRSQ